MNLKDKKHAKMMNDFFEIFFYGKRDKIVNNIRDNRQGIMRFKTEIRRGRFCED